MPDRRTEIVEAAMDLVKAEGLAGLTQPRVARRLALRQSHVTYYFPTRDDLLAAVTEFAVRHRVAALGSLRTARTAAGKIAALAEVLADPEQTRLLLALTQISDTTPALRAHFRDLSTGVAPAAVSLLQAAGADPTPEAVTLLQTTSTGMAIVALATGQTDRTPMAALLSRLLDTLPRAPKDRS